MTDILILTASFGMGHISVSKALKEQIESENKNAEIVISGILEIVNPKIKNFSSKMYSELTENYPGVYNAFYDIKVNYKNNIIDSVFCNLCYKKLYEYILVKKPRVIISTFPLCSCIVSKIKEEYNVKINLITVITDVVDSWEWIYEETNMYLVPTKEIKNRLISKGVSRDIIIVTGIPVTKEFIKQTKIGIVINDLSSLPYIIDYYINNPGIINYYYKNIRKIKKTLNYKNFSGSVINEVIQV